MKNSSSRPFVILVFNHVKPGFDSEYENLVAPVLDAMRHEPTFINTILHRDPAVPTRYMLYEAWVDRDDFLQVRLIGSERRSVHTFDLDLADNGVRFVGRSQIANRNISTFFSERECYRSSNTA